LDLIEAQGTGVIMSETSSQGSLSFAVDAGLLFELGERLVARASIALSELIKNAYDADATHVNVRFENVTKRKGTVIVQDNGAGMTFETIVDHWMRIATTDKVRNPISPWYGRRRTGAKGIGRFAARRLADKLRLVSVARRADGTMERVTVRFDWRKDFQPGQVLTDIPVAYERERVPDSTPTGVSLFLEAARDIWNEGSIKELREDLLTLVSPFPDEKDIQAGQEGWFERDPGFSVVLDVPEFPDLTGELKEHFLEAAWAVLNGLIDEHGQPHYHLSIRQTGETLAYVEEDRWFTALGGTTFKIYFHVYKAAYLSGTDITVSAAIRYGRQYGGVRIYLDGFRVYGYAERDTDWLGLNALRAERVRRPSVDLTAQLDLEAAQMTRQPFLLIPGNNQLFGAVFLSQSSRSLESGEGIELNVSRDRLVENTAFEQLRSFLRIGIFWMTLQYARVEQSKRKKPKADIQEQLRPIAEEIATPLRQAERIVESAALPLPQKDELSHWLAQIREHAVRHDEVQQRQEEEAIGEASMLRVLASIGTMVSFLDHQLKAVVGDLSQIATVFEVLSSGIDGEARETYSRNVEHLRLWVRLVKQQVGELTFLLAPEARTERQPYNVREEVTHIAQVLEGYRTDFGIEFQNEVHP
jgi:anti-sigma regulatory factor (Ser/Thr protein kinase)